MNMLLFKSFLFRIDWFLPLQQAKISYFYCNTDSDKIQNKNIYQEQQFYSTYLYQIRNAPMQNHCLDHVTTSSFHKQ